MPDFRRGDIWIVDLKPQGNAEEPAKERPCLIVQETRICAVEQHGTIIVIPVSSQGEQPEIGETDIRVPVGAFAKDTGGRREMGYALVDCVRSVSKRRFTRGPVHACAPPALRKIENVLRYFLSLH
jgi:mRNA interferase MazF